MPTSLEQVQEFLDEYDLKYQVDTDHDAILIGFRLDPESTSFRDRDGDAYLQLVIRVLEEGEFLGVFSPQAWNLDGCPHKAAVFEALAAIQARYKLLRFDYDTADGEIRPNVELPLEDAELTSRLFHRMMHAVMHGVQRFDGVIRQAMQTGEVSFASLDRDEAGAAPDVSRLQRLAAEAGGLEALERIACGCHVEPVEEGGPASAPGSRTVAEPPPPPPKPVIRRIWESLFGADDPDAGTERRAG